MQNQEDGDTNFLKLLVKFQRSWNSNYFCKKCFSKFRICWKITNALSTTREEIAHNEKELSNKETLFKKKISEGDTLIKDKKAVLLNGLKIEM